MAHLYGRLIIWLIPQEVKRYTVVQLMLAMRQVRG